MGCRNRAYLTLFLLLALTTLQKRATAGGQQEHPAESEVHHPKDWHFTLPQGDPSKGREVFAKFACFTCHRVVGEDFPDPGVKALGPELTKMGAMHPLEFFAESVLNPDAVVAEDRYRREDGGSMMRSLNNLMTVQELIHLSAFLASLRPPGHAKVCDRRGEGDHRRPQPRFACCGARGDPRIHGGHDDGLQGRSALAPERAQAGR